MSHRKTCQRDRPSNVCVRLQPILQAFSKPLQSS
jgi:hypothetical protein